MTPVAAVTAGRRWFHGFTVCEPWLSEFFHLDDAVELEASMGPRFANRGYLAYLGEGGRMHPASMGPRFANRGYLAMSVMSGAKLMALQWVHGSRTVVIQGLRR